MDGARKATPEGPLVDPGDVAGCDYSDVVVQVSRARLPELDDLTIALSISRLSEENSETVISRLATSEQPVHRVAPGLPLSTGVVMPLS